MTQLLPPREANRRMMSLAWPAIIENLSSSLVIFIDSAMVGSLGAAATAAVGINASPSWLMGGLVMSLGVAGTALSARMTGAGEKRGLTNVAQHILFAGLLLSVILMTFAMLAAPWIPRWLNADPAIHADAATYLRFVAIGAIPNYMGGVSGSLLRGVGDTKTPMRATLMSHLVNVTFNFLLIFPSRHISVLGMQVFMPGAGLGVKGAAIATALSYFASGSYLLHTLFSYRSGYALKKAPRFRPDMSVYRRMMRIALPTAMERVSINLGQIVFTGMVASLGTYALAAHHLTITIESLGYMPGYGFSVAAATLVGQALGAQQREAARDYGLRTIRWGAIMMSLMGVVMFILADQLIALFTPDPMVRQIGASLIRIVAFEQPFSALSIIVSGALRGAGDTTTPFYIALGSMWGVRIVLAYVLGTVMGLGVQGIWIAMLSDLAVRGLLLLYRFLKGNWQHRQV